MSDDIKKLNRSTDDRWLAGVCGGLAKYFNVDPTLVRVIFVILALIGLGGVIIYLILWVIIFAFGLFGYSPTLSKQLELAKSVGPDSDEYKSVAWRGTILGILAGLVVLFIIYLMVFQPALWG